MRSGEHERCVGRAAPGELVRLPRRQLDAEPGCCRRGFCVCEAVTSAYSAVADAAARRVDIQQHAVIALICDAQPVLRQLTACALRQTEEFVPVVDEPVEVARTRVSVG